MQDQEIRVVWSRLPFYRFMSYYLHEAKAGINPKTEMLLGMGVNINVFN